MLALDPAIERYLSNVADVLDAGVEAIQVLMNGGPPNVPALEEFARMLEECRTRPVGLADGPPTVDDVRRARELAEGARAGAPMEVLRELAERIMHEITEKRAHA